MFIKNHGIPALMYLTREQVVAIREDKRTLTAVAKEHGICVDTVRRCRWTKGDKFIAHGKPNPFK